MEASVLSPTSWEKRRAWLRQSRNWQTQVLEEEALAALRDVPDAEPSSLDDVFQEGNPINKIEDWLQDCGVSEEEFTEDTGQSIYNGCYSHGTSFEDDLTLGAEATLLDANGKLFSRNFLQTARPGQLLDLGCSLASSSMTGGTNKTSSSISEILDQVQEDAEDVLFRLGFGQEDHKDTSRIPARFFTNPSQAKGIDFQLFLKSQVRRIEMEDPCLMLASRFKQVQTLAVTADAFFCLYSYVSKTPVQKFTPSHMFWNYNPTDAPSIKILTPEPEPHSPRERLRKAISKMCLYTGARGQLSLLCDTPKKNSLDQVVWEVMDRVRGEKLVLQKGAGFEEGQGEDPKLTIGDRKFSASSFPLVLCPKEEPQQEILAVPQTLDCKAEPSCWTQPLNKTQPPWSRHPVQAREELCSLQESHSDNNETFWTRKSKARKCLFQKSPSDKKVESLDLCSTQQKQSPNTSEMYQSLTQHPQDSFSSAEGQSNCEEEESCTPDKPIKHPFYQTYLSKDSQSLLNQHHNTYPTNNGFPEDPTSHLWQEAVYPFPSSRCPLALQTPECTRRPTAWYIKKIRPKELDSTF
ncbi:protein TESPA1 [Thomomys bottae]